MERSSPLTSIIIVLAGRWCDLTFVVVTAGRVIVVHSLIEQSNLTLISGTADIFSAGRECSNNVQRPNKPVGSKPCLSFRDLK